MFILSLTVPKDNLNKCFFMCFMIRWMYNKRFAFVGMNWYFD